MYVCKKCGQTYPEYVAFCAGCGNNYMEQVAERRNSGIYINQGPKTFAGTHYSPGAYSGPAYEAPPPAYRSSAPTYGYITPPAPRGGKAKGIVGMCFSIESIVSAIICFCYSIMVADIGYEEACIIMFFADMIFLATSIVGTVLSSSAREKGFVNGITTTGKVLGIISIAICALSMFICLCGL